MEEAKLVEIWWIHI